MHSDAFSVSDPGSFASLDVFRTPAPTLRVLGLLLIISMPGGQEIMAAVDYHLLDLPCSQNSRHINLSF